MKKLFLFLVVVFIDAAPKERRLDVSDTDSDTSTGAVKRRVRALETTVKQIDLTEQTVLREQVLELQKQIFELQKQVQEFRDKKAWRVVALQIADIVGWLLLQGDFDGLSKANYLLLCGILLATQMIASSNQDGLREVLKKFPVIGQLLSGYLTSPVQYGARVIQIIVAIALGSKIIDGVQIS